jgi:hypothetical protein
MCCIDGQENKYSVVIGRFTSLQHFVVDCIRSYRVGQLKLFSNNCVHVLEIDHSSEKNNVSGP